MQVFHESTEPRISHKPRIDRLFGPCTDSDPKLFFEHRESVFRTPPAPEPTKWPLLGPGQRNGPPHGHSAVSNHFTYLHSRKLTPS
jgi:hypothetical protein